MTHILRRRLAPSDLGDEYSGDPFQDVTFSYDGVWIAVVGASNSVTILMRKRQEEAISARVAPTTSS